MKRYPDLSKVPERGVSLRRNPPEDEAVRKIGDAFVFIELDEDHPDVRMSKRAMYKGKIVTENEIWFFDELGAPAYWSKAWDSDEAFDEMAGSAVSFGAYYTTHNRGDDVPDWAPDAEVADAIEEATAWAMDDQGNYDVERVTHYEDNPPTFTAKGERMYESIKAGYLKKGMRPADAKRIAAATVYARAGGGAPGLVKSQYANPSKRRVSHPSIRVTYSIVTPESAEQGDYAESGWINEEGVDMTPDEYDIEEGITAVDKAVEFMRNEGATEASSSHFHPGIWYTAYAYSEDLSTGEEESRSYHPDGFTRTEEREIFKKMTR